ncbi:phosphatase PAP2 family protein [Bacillus sp. FJAT-49732]|uniref:Phosphatase PAP2 family protein n=1 Tax=Lederbergia citrisecunda TaxID=2833583 RepID=A0A942TSH2_9BACI|nr:phosphatase PAP2 family protein [Lederbergia citrisecunda]MBS4201414.1 phosphatase PAP2 family protein [Lederbergia citrisecunda]
MNFDYRLFELINQFAGNNDIFDQMVSSFSKFGPILLGLVLVWLWFSKSGDKFENRKIVLFAVTITIFVLGVDKIIEMMYFRPRPFVDHAVNLLSTKSDLDPSFPSNHSAGAFAIAFSVFWRKRKIGSFLIIFAIFMALSRVFIGVHYPLDVIAGAIIAFIVTAIVYSQRRLLEPLYNRVILLFTKTNKLH